MSEVLDKIVDDVAEDEFKDASRDARTRGLENSRNPVIHAVANGFGLVAVRVCIFLLTIIVGLVSIVGKITLDSIDTKIGYLAAELPTIKTTLDKVGDEVTNLKIDDAANKQHLLDQRIEERNKSRP